MHKKILVSKLIIVGNGFDLAHGYRTRYKDYKNYVYRHNLEFYNKIKRYIPEELLWSDFESALSQLDYEQLQEDKSDYLLGYGDDDWSESAHHDFQNEIDNELSFAKDIAGCLREWIKSIAITGNPIISKNIINNANCFFINFNYTDTLESLYRIDEEKILHIHGRLSSNENLVVGHHNNKILGEHINMLNEAEEHGMYITNDDDIRVNEAREIIRDYFINTYKNTSLIIEENKNIFRTFNTVREIYVIGHSISTTDEEYFKEIRKYVSDRCLWIFTSYQSRDRDAIEKLVKEINIKSYDIVSIDDLM